MIDKFTKEIRLQFFLDSPGLIPASATYLETSPKKDIPRQKKTNYVINPREKCSLMDFPEELESIGFELSSSYWQQRLNSKSEFYYVVRFTFTRTRKKYISGFEAHRCRIGADLMEMIESALWRVWGYQDRNAVINLGSRTPIDVHGVKPACYLYVMNNIIDTVVV